MSYRSNNKQKTADDEEENQPGDGDTDTDSSLQQDTHTPQRLMCDELGHPPVKQAATDYVTEGTSDGDKVKEEVTCIVKIIDFQLAAPIVFSLNMSIKTV